MPFTPVADTWEVALDGNNVFTLEPWAMIFHVLDTGDHSDVTRPTAIAAGFRAWWISHMKGDLSDSITLLKVVCRDLESATGLEVTDTTSLPAPGTQTSAPAGGQVAAIITQLTSVRGRSYRGRKYLPGILASDISGAGGQLINSTRQAEYQAQFDTLNSAIAALSLTPAVAVAVASRKLGTSQAVTSNLCRQNLGTVRRRVRPPG